MSGLPICGLCVDSPGPYADYYQIIEVDPGVVRVQRVACERGTVTWYERPHVFIVGGTHDGIHHLKPLDSLARELLRAAKS